MTLMTQVGGVVSVLVVIAIIVLVGALVHRWDRHLHGLESHLVASLAITSCSRQYC